MNSKAFMTLNTSCLSEFSRIMAAKTIKKSLSLADNEVQSFLEREGNQYTKEKPKVAYSVALVLAFLLSENENWQLEDMPLANFGCLPESLLLSVRTAFKVQSEHTR